MTFFDQLAWRLWLVKDGGGKLTKKLLGDKDDYCCFWVGSAVKVLSSPSSHCGVGDVHILGGPSTGACG